MHIPDCQAELYSLTYMLMELLAFLPLGIFEGYYFYIGTLEFLPTKCTKPAKSLFEFLAGFVGKNGICRSRTI